jgi:TonB family protein
VPLVRLVTSGDYPAEAIQNREQGLVAFRLTVGVNGRVTACDILSSSGSALLDASTCRIMRSRGRFRPARDASGNAVADTIESRIDWRIPEGPAAAAPGAVPEGVNAATRLWFTCTAGEAAKLIPSDLAVAEITSRAFAACTALEARIVAEATEAGISAANTAKMTELVRAEVTAKIPDFINQSRAALNAGQMK